jgi:thiol-disulfide isomerase/thioredoxin
VTKRFVALLVLLLFCSVAIAPLARAENSVGDLYFSLVEGKPHNLKSLNGKAYLVDLWTFFCDDCKAVIPFLNSMQERYSKRGLVVLSLNIDSLPNFKMIEDYVTENKIRYKVGHVKSEEKNKFGTVRGVPTIFLVGQSGEILARYFGWDGKSGPDVETKVKNLLK